ncbi:hypothetical protein GH714_015125 [Hevea brasiliensis]|uniref:glucan endo-1,3-beta-D-glucosidase n=1 Tax=Hevea brasiliensis TaxID=3981 RepID=A0A6A6LDM1_HEVBR|nr:hypothetical protein GH714_015125 [Hevea brasiliensis]
MVDAEISSRIGINYGRLGNNLPSAFQSIQIIQSMNAGRVKLYDANPEILKLLSGTKIHVSIMVPNHEIISIASDQSIANKWVQDNVFQYYPDTMIRFILVGNEVLSCFSDQEKNIWLNLVPAMRRIKNSLRAQKIQNIKVGTPLAMDILQTTFPPSKGNFRSDISSTVIVPLLKFLNGTKSFFFIDVYPYFAWSANPSNTSIDMALFKSNENYTDPATGFVYTNLLDQMLDSVIFAMTKLGFPDVRMTAKPPIGTPARPGEVIPTFIFSLYDENQKDGPGTERHWGLLNANGAPIYDIDLTGNHLQSEYGPLPKPNNNDPYKEKLWCIAARGADLMELDRALDYAFSSYWAQFRSQGANCHFNGLAEQTTTNPSRGSCKFPSVTL